MGTSSTSKVRGSLWFIPVCCVLAGIALSLSTVAIDRLRGYDVIPRWLTGGPDAAMEILATIAASMVSLAALVLTITMVVVQLAMGQFSPRIVQTFLQDRPSQFTIGLFVATFAHAMLSMREVQFDGEGQVPGIAVAVAYLLVLTSIAMLVLYVNHIGRSLRVSALIELVGNDTRQLLDRQYPDLIVPERHDPAVIEVQKSGVLTEIDRQGLVEVAAAGDCVLRLVPALGEFAPAGAPLLRIEGETTRVDRERARSMLTLGLERTLDEDVAYGFRMLVDRAERALSDSPFLDPTTTVQALDRLYDGLRQLAVRRLSDGRHLDAHGELRLIVPVMDWDDYVHLAFDEIRLAGAASPQVSRRLMAALEDLLEIAPEERRPVLMEQLELLRRAVEDLPLDQRDIATALIADGEGFGVASGNGHAPALDADDERPVAESSHR
ncbi:MAG: DUF2254 domain-containing protein [Ilumatobacteraceae bacterium]